MRNLKKARESKKLSQENLALLIGRTKPTISRYENGQRDPSIEDLKKLCIALDKSSDYLIGLIDDELKEDFK